MPIDREDGRHWCAPDQETPNAEGVWVCPCEQSWTFLPGEALWIRSEDVVAYHAERAQRLSAEKNVDEPAIIVPKPIASVPVAISKSKGKS